MMLAADAFASWLFGRVADAARTRLVTWVLGDDQERALGQAARAAVQRTAEDLQLERDGQAAHVAMVIGEVFGDPVPEAAVAENATLLEAVQAGIWAQLAPLSDASLTGAEASWADMLGIPAAVLAEQLAGNLLREIMVRGASGGPLAPLASQLNHDVTHLQEQRIEGMLGTVLEELAGLGHGPPAATGAAVMHTLPADVASFTGRQAELDRVTRALSDLAAVPGVIGICAIDGMAGVGKTAFAVHAAHRLAGDFPDGQLFARLHAHTPGEPPAEPADALATLLLTTGVGRQQIPAGLQGREALWRDKMAGRKVLLVLDDAAGSEQVRPLLPGAAGSLVLVTSRHRLTAMPEALPVPLDVMGHAEAARLFVRLAGRPGVMADDDAVASVVGLCGHLPLAISLAAGQFKHHATWTAAGLAENLETAGDRLAGLAAESDSVTASFSLSYRNLRADQKQFFRRLGSHPGTDIDAYAAAALNDAGLAVARKLLDELFSYHLIDEPVRGRYRFHDLIGDHARALATEDAAAARDAAMSRLLQYYLNAAQDADRHLATRTARNPPVTGAPPTSIPALVTDQVAITWMEAERLNLHAAAGYAAAHGHPGHAIAIASAMHGFLRSQGHWDQSLILHGIAVTAARETSDPLAQASAQADLGDMQMLTEDYAAAAGSLSHATELFRSLGDRRGQAMALSRLGDVRLMTGDFAAATASGSQALELFRRLGDRRGEADALTRLGWAWRHTGDYAAAADCDSQALQLLRGLGDRRGEAMALCYLAEVQYLTGKYAAAAESGSKGLELFRDLGDRRGEAMALCYLGEVQQLTGDYAAAGASLSKALELFRDLDVQLGEASALCYLGEVQQLTGDYPAAAASLSQALALYRGRGVPVGEAEVLNNMGDLSLASAKRAHALACYEQALTIATSVASTPEEAHALEGIGRCHLEDGQPGDGAARLRQALEIYERIGSPSSRRVRKALRDHGL